MKIDVKGHSVLDLIVNLTNTHKVLNQQVNTVIMSEVLARQLWYEIKGINRNDCVNLNKWREILGGRVYGLKIMVETNAQHDWIQVYNLEES